MFSIKCTLKSPNCTPFKRSMCCCVSLQGPIKNGLTRQTISSSFTPMSRNIRGRLKGCGRTDASDWQNKKNCGIASQFLTLWFYKSLPIACGCKQMGRHVFILTIRCPNRCRCSGGHGRVRCRHRHSRWRRRR